MRQGSQSRDQPVLRFAVMCVFCFTLLWHVGCRLRLGVGPGGTSVGVWTVKTPTTCLEVFGGKS